MVRRELPFSLAEYHSRVAGVRAGMSMRGLDALLLVSPVSINYLTGALGGVQFLILPLDGEPTMLSWELELPLVLYSTWVSDGTMYRTGEDKMQVLGRVMAERNLLKGTVGVERDTPYLTVGDYERLVATLAGPRLADGSGIMGPLLYVKSPAEIACIKQAAAYTRASMQAAVEATRAGAWDHDVAAAAYQAAIAAGSEPMIGQPIVTVGWRSGIAHSTHHRHRIEQGDPVWIELAGCHEYYSAPLMRTVFVGKPLDGAQALADASLASLEKVLAVMRAGVRAADVAEAGASVLPLDDPEIGPNHTYGYSIGLGFPPSWADNPDWKIKKGDPTILKTGMVFHVTMGLRRIGKYGAVCSETVAVTDTGCDVLTDFPRQYFYV